MAKDKNLEKKVLCFLCNKPIHVKEWGGVIKLLDGKQGFFHNTLHCLILMADNAGVTYEPRR